MSIEKFAIFVENLIADVDRLLTEEPKEIKPAGNEDVEEYLRRAMSWSQRCKKELLPLSSQVENDTQHAFVEKIFERIYVTGWNWSTPMVGTTAQMIRRKTSENLRESRSALQSLVDFLSRIEKPSLPKRGVVVRPNPFLLLGKQELIKSKVIFAVMAWELKDTVYQHIEDILIKEGYKLTYAGDRSGQVIFEDIWRLMNEAEVILVDFTGRRPNVYLEFGMAIVLGKPIVAITQSKQDLPSDTPNLKYIEYTTNVWDKTLQTKLVKAIKDTLQDFQKIE
jgi:hypothetical protein